MSVYQHKKKKYDPNEPNWFEVKFNKLKYSVLRKHRYRHHSQSNEEKSLEIDAIHVIKEIEDYGFNFFAEHFLWEKMQELETIARQMR